MPSPGPELPRWLTMTEALAAFALAAEGTQGQRHIRPLHWYVACRLVIEGGFHPDDIVPRPPLHVRPSGSRLYLEHDANAAVAGERTLLGGLKTKAIDVVVSKNGIGPCVAVSLKGTLKAFRNLTNRMEEAVGDCTNLHIAYPALVYAFWNVMRANREGPVSPSSPPFLRERDGCVDIADVAIKQDGTPSASIERYHYALEGLSGRDSVRAEPSKYEAAGLTLVNVEPPNMGQVFASYPGVESNLRVDRMFHRIYQQYDLRFVYQAPALEPATRRLVWAADSPVVTAGKTPEYEPRVDE